MAAAVIVSAGVRLNIVLGRAPAPALCGSGDNCVPGPCALKEGSIEEPAEGLGAAGITQGEGSVLVGVSALGTGRGVAATMLGRGSSSRFVALSGWVLADDKFA
jgi:hypothetical protein